MFLCFPQSFLWWWGCVCVFVFLLWCGCVSVVAILWLRFCGGVVVFFWWCGCVSVVVWLCFRGCVFVVVWWCLCDFVVVSLCLCFCVFVMVWLVVFLWWCGCVFVFLWLRFWGCVVVFLRFVGGAPVSKKRPLRISRPDWMHASYVLERPVMIRYVCAYVGMPSAWFCRPMFPQTTWLSCSCSDTWTKAKQNNDMLQRPKALKRVF